MTVFLRFTYKSCRELIFCTIINVTNSSFIKQVNKKFIILFYTSVNSAYLNKCHNCKSNKCFMLSLSENISFYLTGSSWSKSATVITERPANAISAIIINIFPKPGSILVHKSLDTIEGSSIINNFTSDNLFLKGALDLLFKQVILFLV